MNAPQNQPDNSHDWHDALLDRGLAEIIGGETPPDLSEKILAAASTESHQSPVTLSGEAPALPISKRKHWATFAAAACLFLSVGTWLLVSEPRYRRDIKSYAKVNTKQRELEREPRPIRVGSDWTYRRFDQKSTTDAATGSAKEQSRDPMMAVTPHIIIQEEEEERLGIATEEAGEAMSRFKSAPETNMGLKGLINDGYAVEGEGAGVPAASSSALHQPQGDLVTRREMLNGDKDVHSDSALYSQASKAEIDARISASLRTRAANSPKSETLSDEASEPQPDHLFGDALHPQAGFDVKERFHYWGHEPQPSRDQYAPIHENPFVKAIGPDAVSTFSIDVDTASYANVRQFLTQSRQLPPPDAVRIEELINYFDYDYAGPTDNTPFAAHMEVAACPWNNEHRLARIAIKGKEIDREQRPQSNLVFLIDVSGSMNEPNKLPLLVEGMKLLTRELGENDKVAIVVYASTEGVVLESTRGDQQTTILAALNRLQAGGSTAGGAGINRAYQIALDNFIEGATNRVILCTDGDFNVGVTGTDDLTRLAEQKAKTGVFLTVLGFGRGNLNDAMMESISGKGNGNYHYVDSLTEARKVLVEEMTGTLITIAKDVKIQVEFNPAKVAGYRLIGYENRMLATEDFNDDKKDAGEIGAGHTVTALYEIVPAGKEVNPPAADPLKYQSQNPPPGTPGGARGESEEERENPASNELLTLKLRYKLPDADKSTKLEFPITDNNESFAESTKDFQFAAAVASFGMLLRHSQHQGETSFDAVSEIAQSAINQDPHNYRAEFLELVRIAKQLSGEQPSSAADPSTTEGP